METALKKKSGGGARPNAGRPRKPENMLVTVSLRRTTVAALKDGAGSEHFGAFLQDHLNRYPPPNRQEYLARTDPASSMGPSPLLIRKEVNKFLRQQKELEQKKIERRMRRMARKPRQYKKIEESLK